LIFNVRCFCPVGILELLYCCIKDGH
jgi:hypothetical protein